MKKVKYYYSEASRKRIRSLILLVSFTTALLITTVYAWFSTQKNVSINNLKGRIEVAEGLQISLDADTWGQELYFGTTDTGNLGQQTSNGIVASWEDFDLGIQTTSSPYVINGASYVTNNIRPIDNSVKSTYTRGTTGGDSTTGYLLPVSSAGMLTTDYERLKFFEGTYSGVSLKSITQSQETTETGMYAFDVYLMNTTKGNNSDQLYLNCDSIVREIKQSVTGEDYGLKNCVRVGFAFYSGITGTSSSKDEIIKKTYGTTINQLAIWEPNYDTHSEYVMKQNEKLRTLASNVSNNAVAITSTQYISEMPLDTKIENVYTEDSLIGLDKYTAIKTKGEIKTGEVNEQAVSANASGVQKIIDTDGEDVKLIANSISKLRIYVWLEGQDPDCINWASHSDGVDVTIGLVKASSGKLLKVGSLKVEEDTENEAEKTYTWTQYRDETEKKAYVTNGEVTLEVGSAVTGYTAGGKGDGNWCVLGAENGHLLIATNNNVTTQNLSGQNGYVNGITTINNAVSSYKNTTYADSVRSINVDDINRVTGYNPEATGDGTGGKYGAGNVYEYGHQVKYTLGSDGKVYYQGTNNNTTSTSSSYTSFTYYNGTGWVTLGSGDSKTLTSNYYWYYPNTLGTSSSGTTNGIANDSLAYTMLFANTEVTGSAGSYNYTKCYWLGSQYVFTDEGFAHFGLRFVSSGRVGSISLYGSDGYTVGGSYGVRPAVSLKSDIKVDSSGNIST